MKFNLINFIENLNEEIAKEYGVTKEENLNLSKLQMHKILFFLYGGFYKNFHKELFVPNFEAWKYGPVEIDYKNNNKEKFNITIKTSKQFDYLTKTTRTLLRKSVWILVDVSHKVPAWSNNYIENEKHCKIPKLDIHNSFEEIEI